MPDLYVPLDVNFQDDDRLIDVSPDAELMFIRSLALCKRLLNDGALTNGQARRLGDKLEDWREAARELVAVGLWEDMSGGGFLVRSWAKHNRTAGEIKDAKEAKATGGLLGNHNKWHRDRGEVNPECPHCPNEDRSDSDSHSDIGSESDSESDATPHSEVETEYFSSADGAREALAAAISTACRQERIPPPGTRPRQQLDVAAADIAAQGGEPHEVPGKAREFRRKWPDAELTPMALAKHWPQLVPPKPNVPAEYDPTPALEAAGLTGEVKAS